MKRQRDSSVESARSSELSAQEAPHSAAPIKLSARDRAYETVIATLRKRINELQAVAALSQNEEPVIARKGGDDLSNNETVRKLRDDNEKLTARIKQMETKMNSEIEKARTEMIKLKEQLNSKDTQIRALVKEKAQLTSTNESLEEKVSAAVQECNLQTNLRQRLRENYDNLMREFQRASERGDAFVQKIYTLQGELERLESTKRELVEEVSRLSRLNTSGSLAEPIQDTSYYHADDVDYG